MVDGIPLPVPDDGPARTPANDIFARYACAKLRLRIILSPANPGGLRCPNLTGGVQMAEQARKLTESEIAEALSKLPGWSVENGKLHRQYQFKNFIEAFGFMASAALVAESMNHHPEWFNVYHKVVVDLMTHSVGAISNLDFDLARMMETLAQQPVS